MHVAHGDVVAWDHDIRFRLYDCVTKRLLGVNAVITIVVLQGMGRKGGMIRRADKVDLAADASESHRQAGGGKPSARRREQNFGCHGGTFRASLFAEQIVINIGLPNESLIRFY